MHMLKYNFTNAHVNACTLEQKHKPTLTHTALWGQEPLISHLSFHCTVISDFPLM